MKLQFHFSSRAAEPTACAARPSRRGQGRVAALWTLGWLALSALVVWLAVEVRTQRSLIEQLASGRGARPGALPARNGGGSGPWGRLEYVEIQIERPDDFIFVPPDTTPIRWVFADFTTNALRNLFLATDLSASQSAWLLDPANWQATNGAIVLTPPRELVLGLSPEARRKLYATLSLSERNQLYMYPFSHRADRLDDWFADSGLSAHTISEIKRLLVPRGNSLCFSDLLALLPELPSPEEKLRFIKTLSRTSTVLAKLHVPPDADIDALVNYWGRGGRAKDLRPLLESLARVPGGATIDVAHLLPPLARKLLYTYPYPTHDPEAARPNCFWTAMNFFNEQPDDRFTEFAFTEQTLLTDYYPYEGDPTFGDVLLFSVQDGGIFHAATYIADGIVLTKNGKHFSYPWILMKLDDLLAFYPFEKPVEVTGYRSKRF